MQHPSPAGTIKPYRRVIWLICVVVLEAVCLASMLRLFSYSDHFSTFQGGLRFLALALVGSARWPDITSQPAHELLVVITFLLMNFGMICLSRATIVELIESLIWRAITYSREKLNILSLRGASNSDFTSESRDTDDIWVKNRLPGWYYKVVVPNRLFRKKVLESIQSEAISLNRTEVAHELVSSGKKDLLASLNEIPTDFKSNLNHIKADFQSQTKSINSKLSEIQALIEDLYYAKPRTELIMNR
jgi:hypothetical protein